MVNVQRANVILTVEDDEAEKYFEKGYNILDSYGNIVKASVPNDLGTLQKAYVDLQEQLKQRDAMIADLQGQIASLISKPAEESQPTTKKSTYKRKTQVDAE